MNTGVQVRPHRSVWRSACVVLVCCVLSGVGRANPSVPPPMTEDAAKRAPALVQTPQQSARARLQYMQHCMGCHLPDGSGAPEQGIPSMRGQLGAFLAIPGGRAFIVQVPGVMNSSLSDEEIARLMNWLLPQVSASTLPSDTPAYTAAEIGALRQRRPVDVPAARAALIERMNTAQPR